MKGESGEGDEASDDRVPVEDAGVRAGLPVGPKGKEEVAVRLKRNAAQDVGQCCSVKDGEQSAGEAEDAIEQSSPHADVDVVAELKTDAAQDEQPEHDHQGEIEAAEG